MSAQVTHLHTIKINDKVVAKQEGQLVTVGDRHIYMQTEHEATYLMAGIEQVVLELANGGVE